MKTIHFISGLPRSGSTMLSAILIQNLDCYASVSSPVASVVDTIIGGASAGTEFAPLMTFAKREAIVRSVFEAYYSDRPEPIIFDTNRSWTAKMPLLNSLFPNAKVIAMVRNLSWIMDSMERLYRRQPYEHTRLFSSGERATVYTRVEALGQRNRLVGLAWASLREAACGEYSKSLLLVDYDFFVSNPSATMCEIYDFIGLPQFNHDYENLSFDSEEFDNSLGVVGLHKVRSKVERIERETVLPLDLFTQYSNLSFWNDSNNLKSAKIIKG